MATATPYKNPAEKQLPAGQPVPLGQRADLYPSAPLPDYNAAGGPAFAARMKIDTRADLMAVVCNTNMPPRIDAVGAMRSIDHPGVLRLIDSGTVPWGGNDTRAYAFAYEMPMAPRFHRSIDEPYPAMGEDALQHHFIKPLIGALKEFMNTGTFHGAIRPTNLFWREGSVTPPQFGECLSAPPGIGQPVLFETIPRALAAPIGRGPGSHTDDCYAFGVMVACMVAGQNPLQGMDDRAILQAKVEKGSFAALIGNRRLNPAHIELLRGLLTDDARQRWTATDLDQWLEGRRFTPKSSDAGKRSSRSIAFGDKEYWQLRPLAMAFAENVGPAAQMVENGALDKWLRRSMGDDEKANAVEEAINSMKESGKTAHAENQLVTRACIALDPSAPIRYRGVSVMPAGIAPMLAEAVAAGGNLQVLSEIITSQLVTFWVNMQKDAKTDLVPLAQQLERVRSALEKSSFGNGMERVLYELNPALPCLSPLVRAQYITIPKALLPAIDRAASQPGRPREPLDRHIAAFLVVREKRSEMLFNTMSEPEGSIRRGLAVLSLFSEMQYRYGPEKLPGLAMWLMPLLEASSRRYLNKNLREHAQKQIKEIAERGDLSALVKLVDDPARVDRDQQEFMAARLLYLSIVKEMADLERRLASRDTVAKTVGKPMAASIASLMAVALILVAILRAIWHAL